MAKRETRKASGSRTILVVCGIIRRGRDLLIAQRKPDSRLEPLKWEFPGGKIEFSENPAQALRREIKEELNFEIEVGEIFQVSSHNYRPEAGVTKHVLMLAYGCAYQGGEPSARDVHDFRWIRVEDLDRFEFAAADHCIVDKIKSNATPRRDEWGKGGTDEKILSDKDCPVEELKREVNRFVAERNWEQFHSPKNLSMSISIEAAELMEHFQWATVSEARFITADPEKFEEVAQEVSDIVIYVLSLCHMLNIDLSEAVTRKLKLNREKYPLEKYWGRYTDK